MAKGYHREPEGSFASRGQENLRIRRRTKSDKKRPISLLVAGSVVIGSGFLVKKVLDNLPNTADRQSSSPVRTLTAEEEARLFPSSEETESVTNAGLPREERISVEKERDVVMKESGQTPEKVKEVLVKERTLLESDLETLVKDAQVYVSMEGDHTGIIHYDVCRFGDMYLIRLQGYKDDDERSFVPMSVRETEDGTSFAYDQAGMSVRVVGPKGVLKQFSFEGIPKIRTKTKTPPFKYQLSFDENTRFTELSKDFSQKIYKGEAISITGDLPTKKQIDKK